MGYYLNWELFSITAEERKADEEKKELQRLNQLLEQNMMKSGVEQKSMSSVEVRKPVCTTDSCCQTTAPPDAAMESCAVQTIPVKPEQVQFVKVSDDVLSTCEPMM
ncbi:hypothetical protein ANCCAN_23918 [Ancylostoma caninum]|uniref:Uncharacterized protein n=1 Tax=Ancylostoma caninum TaxID=29170 RepID=A0A368FFG1_ANCCA|nr:hypothetical protein ANCCAN_23918 [Ancylostoma caninum]